jgi:tRNA dimethylallyltransferase
VVVLVGPTAAGKSAAALSIAQELGGEIVNADAMQLYIGMDIGTAKVAVAQRESVPHHLLDVWPVTMRASVVDFQRRSVDAVGDILSRGRVPIVAGGSGLYVRSLIDNLRIPPTDATVRGRLEVELAELGAPALHDRLGGLDPTAAAAILPSNGRRVVRALEVVELTGSFSATLPDGSYRWPHTVQIGLDAADLDDRIEQRVRRMFDGGLGEEVGALERDGLRGSPTASKALGYAQILAATADDDRADTEVDSDTGGDRGFDRAAVVGATALATRRFARRQRSWFRRDTRINWTASVEDAVREAIAATRGAQVRPRSVRLP